MARVMKSGITTKRLDFIARQIRSVKSRLAPVSISQTECLYIRRQNIDINLLIQH